MGLTVTAIRDRARTPMGQKAIRYTMVSVISVIVSQVSLGILYGGFHWTAKSANIAAVCISGLPSYYLNRAWAWGKRGRSHLWREVVPFWSLAFLGLVLSTLAADAADSYVKDHFASHLVDTGVVMAASVGAFGVLWVGKFILFNKLIFVNNPDELIDSPALDGRTGIPA